jgi:hypothetical protein
MMESIHRFANNVFSQSGEDGIIEEVLKRTGKDLGTCVEFGAHDGKFCSNTYRLLQKGWKGLMVEGDTNLFAACCSNVLNLKCEVKNEMVTASNVNDLLFMHIDVLSMDTDGPDAEIWAAYKGLPDIVVIEINSSLDPEKDFFSYDTGSNYSFMKKLGEGKGYFLLCHTGNMIFVLNKYKELFPDAEETFNTSWL